MAMLLERPEQVNEVLAAGAAVLPPAPSSRALPGSPVVGKSVTCRLHGSGARQAS